MCEQQITDDYMYNERKRTTSNEMKKKTNEKNRK